MPSFLYEVTRGFDTGGFAGQGAYHAIDIPYLFGSFGVYGVTPDPQALAISAAMRSAWSGLASDPTNRPPIAEDGSALWPTYDAATSAYAIFGDSVVGATDHRDGQGEAPPHAVAERVHTTLGGVREPHTLEQLRADLVAARHAVQARVEIERLQS